MNSVGWDSLAIGSVGHTLEKYPSNDLGGSVSHEVQKSTDYTVSAAAVARIWRGPSGAVAWNDINHVDLHPAVLRHADVLADVHTEPEYPHTYPLRDKYAHPTACFAWVR